MKLERTKNTKRNMIFGLANKVVCMLFPFAIRSIIINYVGKEYLGLDSLFTSILQVLNLAELGFSSAVVYSMYKPIADEDYPLLCSILKYYKKVYFEIGIVIFIGGLLLIPLLPHFINDNRPETFNIYIAYVIYLLNTVVSYAMFAYRGSLLNAYQRFDVVSNISTISKLFCYVAQIFVLLATKNYYFYIVVLLLSTILNNVLTQIVTNRLFPNIFCKGELSLDIKKDIKIKIKGLMISKICDTSRNAFDSIFVSSFIGLVETAIYNNYFMIMNAVVMLLSIINHSIIGGVGNSLVTENKDKNYRNMTRMNFAYMWLSGWCTICLICLYQPFTRYVFGEDMLFPMHIVILFCIYFYVLKMGDIRSVYVEAAGLWWENRFKSLVEAILNLVLNFILGWYFGVVGIVVATLISLFFINFIWGSNLIFKFYFTNTNSKEYYTLHIMYGFVTLINCCVTYKICTYIQLSGIWDFCVRGFVCLIIPNLIYLCLYMKTKIYAETMPWLLNKIVAK